MRRGWFDFFGVMWGKDGFVNFVFYFLYVENVVLCLYEVDVIEFSVSSVFFLLFFLRD